jgi:hypothetical protein
LETFSLKRTGFSTEVIKQAAAEADSIKNYDIWFGKMEGKAAGCQ